ncbi:ATP-dependent zinc metalloprotease FtsH [Ureibacillus sp. FSL K6-8385]|uniref:ATP-dependent zinc metalloprotease FtsH n=1 Tax=Ureibacillus terrenus TaxID=118246 RepID=A0A540UZ94_9BACL|nr:ATP-dependent zinc metalloprotease FtsH [Ureibacillus terrenus]MED3662131.1 ATP-dependent zinc metalloprotease FtsH [Ureibacillus terrenus]MED3764455.1 ATP-dependent zinc metalloprotease FtsH [Ureibacillus terrenus]TQE89778.1 ATP-dependent zinc metalloprotease FtsH [Ureibacillus terrenus]
MQEKQPQNRSLTYYFFILMAIVLLNALILPEIQEKKVEEVDYGTFLQMIEDGKVKEVTIEDNAITFKDKKNEDIIYKTGAIEDPKLVDRLYEADVPFTKVVPNEFSPLIRFILMWIVPLVIILFLGSFLTRSFRQSRSDVLTFGKANAKIYVESETGKSFDDVAGQDEAKEALKEIVDFLHNPEKYRKVGAKLPKGVLLVGPPGTGKTLIAKAVAGEAKVPFFTISGSEFVEMFVGMGAARVRDLFKQAQEKAPCIVFIDEIDAIGKKRGVNLTQGNDEREQTLNQLLYEMDGFDSSKGVVILAATNRPEVLDQALLRPGRFDRRIPLELPDLKGREAILKVHLKKVAVDENIDVTAIAKATPGASGADLANIVNEAALRAVRMGREKVVQEDLEEAVDITIAGYKRKSRILSPKEKKIVAYHEIGHAIVAAKQSHSSPVQKITIIPRTSGALGYTMQVEEEERYLLTKEEIFNKIVTLTGGRTAEEIVFDSITSGAANDIEQATKLARAMVTRFGMSDNFGMMGLETVSNAYLGGETALICSDETAAKIDQEVQNIIESAHKKARQILTENINKLHELAEYLLEKETISGEEFMRILENEPAEKE